MLSKMILTPNKSEIFLTKSELYNVNESKTLIR